MQQLQVFAPLPRLAELIHKPNSGVEIITANEQRDKLLVRSKAVERVAGKTSQASAAVILNELHDTLTAVEEARKVVKKPFLDICKKIDDAAKAFCREVESEKTRIKGMIAKFQQGEIEKQQEAERKQNEELERLRLKRLAAEAASTLAQNEEQKADAEKAMAETDAKAVEVLMSTPAIVAKPDNVAVKFKWVVEVKDAAALYRVFPELVHLEPKMRDIQSAVKKMAETTDSPTLPGCVVRKELDVVTR